MTWFLVIIIVLLLVNNVRNYRKLEEYERTNLAVVESLAAVIIENKIPAQKASKELLYYLDNTLMYADYDSYMKKLCNAHGIRYFPDSQNKVISGDTRERLIQETANDLVVSHERVKLSLSD